MLWRQNFLDKKQLTNFLERLNHLVPPLYFNFKPLRVPNPMSLSKFRCILRDSALLFSVFKNFLKLKRRGVISWRRGNQLCNVKQLIYLLPHCISILKIEGAQTVCHWSYFNVFYMIYLCFSQFYKISTSY